MSSPDPIGFAGGAVLYAYVRNDPLRRVDPLGLAPAMGHHYVCRSLIKELIGKVPQEVIDFLIKEAITGPTDVPHLWDKLHRVYCWRLRLKINKALIEGRLSNLAEAEKFVAELRSGDNFVGLFNRYWDAQAEIRRLREEAAKTGKNVADAIEEQRRVAGELQERMWRILSKTSGWAIVGILLENLVGDSVSALDKIGNSENFVGLVEALSEGDMAAADRYIGLPGYGGLIGDLVDAGLVYQAGWLYKWWTSYKRQYNEMSGGF